MDAERRVGGTVTLKRAVIIVPMPPAASLLHVGCRRGADEFRLDAGHAKEQPVGGVEILAAEGKFRGSTRLGTVRTDDKQVRRGQRRRQLLLRPDAVGTAQVEQSRDRTRPRARRRLRREEG